MRRCPGGDQEMAVNAKTRLRIALLSSVAVGWWWSAGHAHAQDMTSTAAPASAQGASALPQGGSVTAGSADIGAPFGGAMVITQHSQNAIINWSSFSI